VAQPRRRRSAGYAGRLERTAAANLREDISGVVHNLRRLRAGECRARRIEVDGCRNPEESSPTTLFRAPGIATDWDVTADGSRFLVMVPDVSKATTSVSLIFNWLGALDDQR
jgi:hypothetical protein